MSDEPLYCPWCGKEIGRFCSDDPCTCEHDAFETPLPPREERYCEVDGIIPGLGKHCKFYGPGGNDTGCEV